MYLIIYLISNVCVAQFVGQKLRELNPRFLLDLLKPLQMTVLKESRENWWWLKYG